MSKTKTMVTMILCLFSICMVQGLDLMLNNGQVLNDVTILNKTPQGVNVSANQGPSSGTVILTEVLYKNLTPQSLSQLQQYLANAAMELGNPVPQNLMQNPQILDSVTGAQGLSSIPAGSQNTWNAAGTPPPQNQQVDQNTLVMGAPITQTPQNMVLPANAKNFPSVFQNTLAQNSPIVLPGYPHRVYFVAVVVLLNGTLGWASSADQGVWTQQNYGELYVYGIQIPQGGVWVGDLYPTGRNVLHLGQFFPCYATDVGMARRITASAQY